MNGRHQEIVRALADSVRLLSVSQITKHWWTETKWGRSRARQAIRILEQDQWLVTQTVMARIVHEPVLPVVTWNMDDPEPDFQEVARTLHRRAIANATPITVAIATRRAAALFSSGPLATIKLTQVTHDLNVSELFLHFRGLGIPAQAWVSEDRLPADWPIRERPDAVLKNAAGTIYRAVEYGGDYPVSRLLELHRGISLLGIGYQIW